MDGSKNLSELVGNPTPDNLPLLHQVYHHNAKRFSNRSAIVSRHQAVNLYANIVQHAQAESSRVNEFECLRWNYAQLEAGGLALAAGLVKHGLCKGMSIATVLTNGVEWNITLWAALYLGCPFVPLNPQALTNSVEATHMLKTAAVRVLVARDIKIAASLDHIIDQAGLDINIRIVLNLDQVNGSPANGSIVKDHWLLFEDIMLAAATHPPSETTALPEHNGEDIAVIAFTSGSTSLPKGCPITQTGLALTIWTTSLERTNLTMESRTCQAMPNNHMIGFLTGSTPLYVGGSVAYPGTSFEAKACFETMNQEHCDYTPLVPTMLHALLDHMSIHGQKLVSGARVSVGGAAVSPRHLRECIQDLGAAGVMISFGLTEGTTTRGYMVSDPELLIRGEDVIIGTVSSGCRVRVCEPGTANLVPRGQPGELHQSGPQVIKHYIGDVNKDSFYQEGNVHWLRTGDQAIIDDEDNIQIIGRYKDLIIRGGENISPLSIERILNAISGVDAIVVGCNDEIAGEVPIAVYTAKVKVSAKEMQSLVRQKVGTASVPDEFIPRDKLGISEWPKLVSGKINKTKLTQMVKEYRRGQEAIHERQSNNSNQDKLCSIWSKILGMVPEDLDVNAPIQEFADSIGIMRFRDQVKKKIGYVFTAEQLFAHSTISAQAQLVGSDTGKLSPPVRLSQRIGPPAAADMVHTCGDEDHATKTQALIETVIEPHGLSWKDDVEEVLPAYDFGSYHMKDRRAQSWNFKHSITTTTTDATVVRKAIEAALSNNAILRSFFVRESNESCEDLALHVLIRPSAKFLALCIASDTIAVPNVEALKRIDDGLLETPFPGPLFRAFIAYVEETKTFGITYNANHCNFDALSSRLFYDDLDAALADPTLPLIPHVPYSLYANTYYTLRTSLAAQISIDTHVERLVKAAPSLSLKNLFPPQRAPDFFLGPDHNRRPLSLDFLNSTSQAYIPNGRFSNPNRQILSPPGKANEVTGLIKHSFTLSIPALTAIKNQVQSLTPPVLLKAALSLLLSHQTGQDHVLISQREAARSVLPFVAPEVQRYAESGGLSCTDIAGPTWQTVMDVIPVPRSNDGATIKAWLEGLAAAQRLLSENAAAPLLLILSSLRDKAPGVAELLEQGKGEALRRCSFNWIPGMGAGGRSPYRCMSLVSSDARGDIGLGLVAGVGGRYGEIVSIGVRWDDAQMSFEEGEVLIKGWEIATRWIVEGGFAENGMGNDAEWMSERKVAGFVDVLKDVRILKGEALV